MQAEERQSVLGNLHMTSPKDAGFSLVSENRSFKLCSREVWASLLFGSPHCAFKIGISRIASLNFAQQAHCTSRLRIIYNDLQRDLVAKFMKECRSTQDLFARRTEREGGRDMGSGKE